jgi:hypothetical protein
MKLVRNLAAALLLACALTVNVYAGDQETPGYAPPPPPPPATSTTDKTMTTADTDGKVEAEKPLTEELLVSALLALLTWF